MPKKLHEHRTIVLPLDLVHIAYNALADVAERLPTPERFAARDALCAARDADQSSTKWARISAALGLPNDRPTLDAVIEAIEHINGCGRDQSMQAQGTPVPTKQHPTEALRTIRDAALTRAVHSEIAAVASDEMTTAAQAQDMIDRLLGGGETKQRPRPNSTRPTRRQEV